MMDSFDDMEEFKLKKLPPYSLKRVYPDGRYEVWKHEDFLFFPDNLPSGAV